MHEIREAKPSKITTQPRRKPSTTSSSSSSSASTSQKLHSMAFPSSPRSNSIHRYSSSTSSSDHYYSPRNIPDRRASPHISLRVRVRVRQAPRSSATRTGRRTLPAVLSDLSSGPPGLMRGLISCLRSNNIVTAKYVTKIILALCLAEGNRHVSVEETAAGLGITASERALAAIELMCTTAEGGAEVRGHAVAVPAMVAVVARLAGRGREYAISIFAIVYRKGVSGEEIAVAPAEEVARAVALALEGVYRERKKKRGPPIEDP